MLTCSDFSCTVPSALPVKCNSPNLFRAQVAQLARIRRSMAHPYAALATQDTSAIRRDSPHRNVVDHAMQVFGAVRTRPIQRAIRVARFPFTVPLDQSVLYLWVMDTIPPCQPIHRMLVRLSRLVFRARSVRIVMEVVYSVNVRLEDTRTSLVLLFALGVSLVASSPALARRSAQIVFQDHRALSVARLNVLHVVLVSIN